jgi:hypothetical protein
VDELDDDYAYVSFCYIFSVCILGYVNQGLFGGISLKVEVTRVLRGLEEYGGFAHFRGYRGF